MVEPAPRLNEENRPHLLEELRFAKKQQWAVATAAVTLLAAIFAALQHPQPPLNLPEKIAVAVVITLIAAFGTIFLLMLHNYVRVTRIQLDVTDVEAGIRGVSIVGVLIGTVILAAAFVVYFVTIRVGSP